MEEEDEVVVQFPNGNLHSSYGLTCISQGSTGDLQGLDDGIIESSSAIEDGIV